MDLYEERVMSETVWGEDRIKKLIEVIPKYNPKNVLDVGCSDGFLASKLNLECDFYGVDISKKAVGEAKKKGIKAYHLDINKGLNIFKEGTFDLVVISEVIEHLQDPDLVLKEINRVLKKGGVLILTTPNLASWYNRFFLLFGIQPLFTEVSSKDKSFGRKFMYKDGEKKTPMGHLRIFTLRGLRDLLYSENFKVVKVRGARFLPNKFLKSLDSFFSNFPGMCSIFVVEAIKNED